MASSKKTRGRMGRIRQLPPELRETIDQLLRDGVPQNEIRSRLEPLLAAHGEQPLSAGGLNRYSSRMEAVGQRLREAREVAAAWSARHGDRPETELGQTMIQIVQTLAFEVSHKLASEDWSPDELLATLKDLALLAQRLEARRRDRSPPRAGDTQDGRRRSRSRGDKTGDHPRHRRRHSGSHRRSKPMSAPMTLLPYQARFTSDPAGLVAIEKSRRIGISWATSYEAVMHAGEGLGDVYYQSYALDMARGFIDDAADWGRRLQAGVESVGETLLDLGKDESIQAFRIHLASGQTGAGYDLSAARVPLQGTPRRPRHCGRGRLCGRSGGGAEGGAGIPGMGRQGAHHLYPQRRKQPLRGAGARHPRGYPARHGPYRDAAGCAG